MAETYCVLLEIDIPLRDVAPRANNKSTELVLAVEWIKTLLELVEVRTINLPSGENLASVGKAS